MTPSDPPDVRSCDAPADAVDTAPPAHGGDGGGQRQEGGGKGRPGRARWFTPRRKPLVVAVACAAGLVVLAAAANLALLHTARERVVRAATCKLRPVGRVSADLTGSLAGLRLLTSGVGVRVRADGVRRDGMTLSVVADLHDVTRKGTTSGGTATATIPYDELAKRMGGKVAGLRPAADGHGGLVLTGTVAGLPLPVTVHTAISAGAGAVRVTPTDVDVLGEDIPVARLGGGALGSALAGKLAPRTVKAPGLPSGVELTGARAGADGLGLTLSLPKSLPGSVERDCSV